MKPINILIVGLTASVTTGCGVYNHARNMVVPPPGHSVEFVAGSSSSVLVDFNDQPASELNYADEMGKDKCALFGKSSAVLESLNPRGDDRMRASYLCEDQ